MSGQSVNTTVTKGKVVEGKGREEEGDRGTKGSKGKQEKGRGKREKVKCGEERGRGREEKGERTQYMIPFLTTGKEGFRHLSLCHKDSQNLS